jgi:hypothetical protein
MCCSVAGYSSNSPRCSVLSSDEWNKWGEIRRRVSWMHVMNIKESPRNIREAMGRGKNYSRQKYLVEHFYVLLRLCRCFCHILYYYGPSLPIHFSPQQTYTHSKIKRKIPEDVFSTYNDALENNFFIHCRKEDGGKNVSSLNGKLLFLEWCRVVFSGSRKTVN